MHVFPHEDISDMYVFRVFFIGVLNMYSVTGIRLWFRDFPAAKLGFDFKSGIFYLDEVHPGHKVQVVAIMGPHEANGLGRLLNRF